MKPETIENILGDAPEEPIPDSNDVSGVETDDLQPEEPKDEPQEPEPEDDEPQTIKIEVSPKRKRKPGRPRKNNDDDYGDEIKPEELQDIMGAFEPNETGVYFYLYRIEPRRWYDKQIEGYLEKFTEAITVEEVKKRYGGGKYNLLIFGPKKDRNGNIKGNKIIGRKVFKISGDPIIPEERMQQQAAAKQPEDPDIVQQAMNFGKTVLKEFKEDKVKEQDKSERLMELLLTKKGDDGVNKDVMTLLTTILQSNQQAMRDIQEERRRAEEKHREEMRMLQERHEAQLERIKQETQNMATQTINPFVQLIEKNREDAKHSTENIMKMMTALAENNVKMLAQNNENQIKMVQESAKTQINLLTNELQRLSTELMETRKMAKSDLTSELKKFKMVKDLMGGEGEQQDLTSKLVDKLPEIAESIPDIVSSFSGLFGGGQQQVVKRRPARAIPATTAPPPPPPPLQQPEPQQQPQEPQVPQAQDNNAEIARTMLKLQLEVEDAITKEIEVSKFVEESIFGKYDDEILKKIASLPTPVIINFLEQNLDLTDSVISTVKGKDFLRHMHDAIKKKFGV